MPCTRTRGSTKQARSKVPATSSDNDSNGTVEADNKKVKINLHGSPQLRTPSRRRRSPTSVSCNSTTPLYGLHPSSSAPQSLTSDGTGAETSSTSHYICPSCLESPPRLRLNPSVISDLHDETGSITSPARHVANSTSTSSVFHQRPSSNFLPPPQAPLSLPTSQHRLPPLLWTDKAYTSLLGRTPEELGRLALEAYPALSSPQRNQQTSSIYTSKKRPYSQISSPQTENPSTTSPQFLSSQAKNSLIRLQYLERRLSWLRIILLIGWTGENEEDYDDDDDGKDETKEKISGGSLGSNNTSGGGRLIVLEVVA